MLIGVDGCRGGWLAVMQRKREQPVAFVASTIVDLIAQVPQSGFIGIDIPIGLPNAGPRTCDLEARQRLKKPRSNSVFSAPIRPCLRASSYEEASKIRYKIEGKKMSLQAFGILRKVSEVDEALRAKPQLARRVIEVHPEASFAEWNGGKALRYAKRKADGKRERADLIQRVWPGVVEGLRASLSGQDYVLDDLHDAFAALWTIGRYARGSARELGGCARDSEGLPTRIVA